MVIYLFHAIQHTIIYCTLLAYNLHGKGTMKPKHHTPKTWEVTAFDKDGAPMGRTTEDATSGTVAIRFAGTDPGIRALTEWSTFSHLSARVVTSNLQRRTIP